MISRELNIYDPALCCSTGVCGPEVDPALVRFAADLDWVSKQGARVRRYNLAQEPDAFAREGTVMQVLQQEGVHALPLIVLEGKVVSRGRYPTREELKGWTGVSADGETLSRTAATPSREVSQLQEAPQSPEASQSETAGGGCCGGAAPAAESTSGFGSGCC